jgi:hypothetical protein
VTSRSGLALLVVAGLATGLATLFFAVTQVDTSVPEPAERPAPIEPIAVAPRKPIVFTRPPPAPAATPEAPPPDPAPQAVQTLDDLPQEERAVLKRAAGIALGETMALCEDDVPEGMLAIAVVTLDDDGLLEMRPIEADGAPLDAPALVTCLEDALWGREWPETSSGRVRFGLQLQGPALEDEATVHD